MVAVVLASGVVIARATAAPGTALSGTALSSTRAAERMAASDAGQEASDAGQDRSASTVRPVSGGVTGTALDPAYFADGSCMAFTPSGAARSGETVFIDAGHGGLDPGGTGQAENGAQVYESQVNLGIEMDAMRVLTGEGYRVVVSRTRQTTVLRLTSGDTDGSLLTVAGSHADVAARDVCANKGHASLLIGIYMNSGEYGEAGSVTLYDAARSFCADNERFARLLQHDVLARLNAKGYQIPDGGVSDDSGYGSTLSAAGASYGHLVLLGPAQPGYFTTPSRMPGALIEPLFLTDPFEASVAASRSGQELIAEGMADAVGQYFAASPGADQSSADQFSHRA